MRAVVAIVAGVLVGFAALLLIALVGGLVFPSSARIDGFDAEQLVAAFPTLAPGAKVAIVLSWFGGALAGAMVAKRISGQGWAAWTIAGIFALYVLITVMILPMTGWLQALAVLAPLLGGLIANHLVAARRPADLAAAPDGPL
jgi:hypothetical protein